MKKILLFIVFMTFGSLGLIGKTGGSLKVGMVEWAAYAPLNVADSKHLWEGIEVSVTVFGSNTELNAALENGRIDIALDMLGSWVGLYQKGTPLVVLGETDWSNGGDKIILAKGAKADDLKGKTIGIYLDQPSVTFFLNEFLSSKGLIATDVRAVEMEPEGLSDNFAAGRFPLIVNYDPQAMRAEKAGGTVVATSATYPGCIPEGFVALRKTWERIPAEQWQAFFRGWYKAVKWSQNDANWNEFKVILCEKTFSGAKYSDEELKAMLGSVKVFGPADGASRNSRGGEAEKYLTRVQSFLKDRGELKTPFDPGELLCSEALVKAAKAEL
jgi:NitT/TauT family transport system substrate-binding protein